VLDEVIGLHEAKQNVVSASAVRARRATL
jgi:hypothetical protein